MNGPRTHMIALLAVALLVLGASNGRAQGAVNRAPAIRAKLVDLQRKLWTWPAPPGVPFKIGILGNDPFQQGQINHLDKRLAGEKNVRVIRLANIDAYAPCHILVVSQAADLKAALKKTQGSGVLIIAQGPGLAEQGAVVNFPVVQNRVNIEINMTAAEKAGLKPDPGLVRHAKIIE